MNAERRGPAEGRRAGRGAKGPLSTRVRMESEPGGVFWARRGRDSCGQGVKKFWRDFSGRNSRLQAGPTNVPELRLHGERLDAPRTA